MKYIWITLVLRPEACFSGCFRFPEEIGIPPPTPNSVWILIMPHTYTPQDGTIKVHYLCNGRAGQYSKLIWHVLREQESTGSEFLLWLGVRARLRNPTHIQEPVGFDFHQCQRRENLGFLSSHRCREKKKGWSLKLSANKHQEHGKG